MSEGDIEDFLVAEDPMEAGVIMAGLLHRISKTGVQMAPPGLYTAGYVELEGPLWLSEEEVELLSRMKDALGTWMPSPAEGVR